MTHNGWREVSILTSMGYVWTRLSSGLVRLVRALSLWDRKCKYWTSNDITWRLGSGCRKDNLIIRCVLVLSCVRLTDQTLVVPGQVGQGPGMGGRRNRPVLIGSSQNQFGSHSNRKHRLNINETDDFLGAILARTNYDNQEPPKKDQPTEVQLGIYVNSFYSINEQTMDYSVSMYLRQQWYDTRLKFVQQNNKPPDKAWRLGDYSWNHIWIPDTFFRNEKRASFHDVSVNNRLLQLYPDGKIWYVVKISATLSCPMKLHSYPMDTQLCPMMFESFGYTMDTMYFSWQEKPVEIDGGLQLPQFALEDEILYDCSQNYTAGAFPCLEIRFVLRRDFGFFLIQIYIPSMLIVILSWVSFWINVEASPARVSIGLLTVLTSTTQSAGANASLPRVSYIKAIDVWMSMCLVFVFMALLEYAVVNVLSRRKGVRILHSIPRPQIGGGVRHHTVPTLPPPKDPESQLDQNIVENGGDKRQPPRILDPDGKYKARKIDKLSRKMFPFAFVLFNIVYWIFYSLQLR